MTTVATIGVDLAKNVFQVHGVDLDGQVVVRRQLRRADVLKFFSSIDRCLVGMEACASSHFWARALTALGHEVRLMPPAYVKPYVKRSKTDAADAEAICEAVTRPTMRFVAIKSEDQQAVLMLHKARELLVRQKTMLTNASRVHLAEFGLVAAQGPGGIAALLQVFSEHRSQLPPLACDALDGLIAQAEHVAAEIEALEARILEWHRSNEASKRLATIPGIGPITASAISASVPDATLFRSGRQFAAWLGLTPRAHSSGGHERMMGDQQAGRQLSAPLARRRRNRCAAVCSPDQRGEGMGVSTPGEEAPEGGRGRACQQDGADRLGAPVPQRGLRGAVGIRP